MKQDINKSIVDSASEKQPVTSVDVCQALVRKTHEIKYGSWSLWKRSADSFFNRKGLRTGININYGWYY